MPLIVALVFAIVVQLPLAWILFARQRARVNDAMAAASARRRRSGPGCSPRCPGTTSRRTDTVIGTV